MHSKEELTQALKNVLKMELNSFGVWSELTKALSYGDLRMKQHVSRGGWDSKGRYRHRGESTAIIYSRLTGETVLIINNYYSPREIALKVLDIVNQQ